MRCRATGASATIALIADRTMSAEVEGALTVVEIAERRLEGQREEEAGEDLRAGLEDPQLLQDLVPVAVGALVGGLVPAVVGHVRHFAIAVIGHAFILPSGVATRASSTRKAC